MSKECAVYVIALFAGLCAATIYFFVPFFRYGYDSVNYLEQASSFMARGIFETIPITLKSLENVSQPDNLFPPGYPILIAISSKLLSVPVEVMAPFLSLAALLLLPVGIVFSFHKIIGLWPSLWIAILVTLTPTTVFFGSIAYSDTLSLLLVIFSVNRLLVINNKSSSWFYLGLLTGFSYLLRNANLALLISIFLYLVWNMVVDPENRKMKIKNACLWLSGNAVFIVALFIYNLLIFGKIQPYSMPPSTVGLSQNIHDYIFSQLNTLLAFRELERLLNSVFGILLLISLVIVLLYQTITTWHRWKKIDQQTFLISVAYTAIGAAITIVARTKYQWGVHIEPRYALPYSCFVFVALFIILKNARLIIYTQNFALGLVVTLLLFRIYELGKDLELRQNNIYDQKVASIAKRLKNNPDAICSNLNGRVALSNLHLVYRMVCAAPVREMFLSFEHNKFIDESLKEWADLGAKKGIIVSLFPIGKDGDNLPLKQEDLTRLNSLGWQVERNEKENLVLSRKANSLI
jgi:hypothetical protein